MIDYQGQISKEIKDNFWSIYDLHTSKISTICRQLAFAEGGICWFFISQQCLIQSSIKIFDILFYLILFFILDITQYLTSSMIYAGVAIYFEYKNKQHLLKPVGNVERKHVMNIVPLLLFASKLIVLVIASFFIIKLLTK